MKRRYELTSTSVTGVAAALGARGIAGALPNCDDLGELGLEAIRVLLRDTALAASGVTRARDEQRTASMRMSDRSKAFGPKVMRMTPIVAELPLPLRPAARWRARISRSSFRRSIILLEDPEARLLPDVEHLVERVVARWRTSAAARSSWSRSAFSRSRIAFSSNGGVGLRAGQPPELLDDLIARLLVPAPRFLQLLEPRDELPVLRVVQLQRVLRLDERVGVEHRDHLGRASAPRGSALPRADSPARCRLAVAPPRPPRSRP